MMTRLRFVTLLAALAVLPSAWQLVVTGQSQINPSANVSATISGADGSIVDGDSSVEADVLDLTNSNPLATVIVDANGTQITSFGGGTQYTEGDAADTTLTGTVLMMEGAGNLAVPAQGTVADGLLVNLGSNNDVTLSDGDSSVKQDILDLTNSNPATVAIVDSNGTQITNLGGGTQYTEADTDASITGGVVMWEDTSDTLRAASATYPLPVFNQYLQTIQGDTTDIEAAIELLRLQEGTTHNSGDRGVMIFGVRQDSQVDFGANLDYSPFSINDVGELRVTTAAGSGGSSAVDDADFNTGSSAFTAVGGLYQSGTATACSDGDQCAAGITLGRVLKVIFANADGSLADYSSDYTVDDDAPNEPEGPTELMQRTDSPDTLSIIDGDWVHARANQNGSRWVAIDTNDTRTIRSVTTVTDGSSTSAVSAAGSGVRNFVTDLACANSSATNVTVDIRDGTGGTVLWTVSCPAGAGSHFPFSKPLRGGQNTALAVDPSAAASSVIVSINGYTLAQ